MSPLPRIAAAGALAFCVAAGCAHAPQSPPAAAPSETYAPSPEDIARALTAPPDGWVVVTAERED